MRVLKDVFKREVFFFDDDCDFKDEVKIDAILKKTQQISIEHHDTLSVSKDFYRNANLLFLMASVSLKFNEKIPKLSKIRVISEPFKPKRSSHHRLTEFFIKESDSVAVSVDANWVLVDTLKKRIARVCPKELIFKNASEEAKTHDYKLIKLEDEVFLRRETASYSKCDLNNHVNNTKYAGIILDSLPFTFLKEKSLKRIFIAYRKQILMGESFDIFIARDDNIYYMYGKLLNGDKCFEANVMF